MCVLDFSHSQLFVTPWTVAHQGPLSMGFSRLEYWSELSCPQGIFPTQGSNLHFLCFLHCQMSSLPLAPSGKSNQLSVQFSSVAKSCPTLCDPMNCSMPGLPVHHQLPESTQTHAHQVGDAIQPSHPLSSPSPPALNPSQHQGLFQ